MFKFLSKIVDTNAKELKRLNKIVGQVNELEPSIKALSDSELQAKTQEFKQRYSSGESLDELLSEAYAVVREAAWRTLNQRAHDAQVLGGIVLHNGNIAEMKTGEGKTLAATMPAYLNAISGEGVHIVTVNDYLASRDSEWMGQVYRFLGLEVGLISHDMRYDDRIKAYLADITYGTNSEFVFDFLRDNMATSPQHLVQSSLNYSIIDEVDSILIDEARVPIVISGKLDRSTELYKKFAAIVRKLKRDVDYTIDEKANTVTPTEVGIAKAERYLGVDNLFSQGNMDLSHYLNVSLRAHVLMKRDRDYIVKDRQVVIVDQFTGRLMFGRRYREGLHQAIEAKEGCPIATESQNLASITIPNFYRMYKKLAGMTGTAKTEEEEFGTIYGMGVVSVPTNKPMIRDDMSDVIYKTERAKFRAIVDEIVARHSKGQPILVGTVSIEKSELLSDMLKKKGIKHQVLNAKYHEQEAEIISHAGEMGAVTIATNMAGRGTDIVLGEEVPELGGLRVIGTERHESRRIDNQLRGRSGRQGDQGSSQFFISLEDDLMRRFGSDAVSGIMDKLGVEEDMPLEHQLLTRALEGAQKRVEGRNFNIRKRLLEYDNVINKQRDVIYAERRRVLHGDNLTEQIRGMMNDIVTEATAIYAPEGTYAEDWDLNGLVKYVKDFIPMPSDVLDIVSDISRSELELKLQELAGLAYEKREEELGSEDMRHLERLLMLQIVDRKWMDHNDAMEELREGIGLRAYGGDNPLLVYQKEAYDMFNVMIASIKEDVVRYLFRVQLVKNPSTRTQPQQQSDNDAPKKPVRTKNKIGRNDPCPCGSGKKYKKCCGR